MRKIPQWVITNLSEANEKIESEQEIENIKKNQMEILELKKYNNKKTQ